MDRMQFDPSAAVEQKAYDALVYIGRFQPFHNGHLATVRRALGLADKVVVLVGSANRSRSSKNPWTFEERRAMILASVPEPERVEVRPLPDVMYDTNKWVENVKALGSDGFPAGAHVGLIGHYKDDSSWYLKCFPDWDLVDQPNYEGLNSTDIRRALFVPGPAAAGPIPVPGAVLQWLTRWQQDLPDVCRWVREESLAIEEYRALWAAAPYPPTFVTVDGLVVHGDHMLVIRRDRFPGSGLLALPGGFLDPGERLDDAVLRELSEETCVTLAPEVLKSVIQASQVFDHPDRSTRGRTVTNAYLLDISKESRPEVTAGDDAREVFWMRIDEFMSQPEAVYEDHWFIASGLLAKRKKPLSGIGKLVAFCRAACHYIAARLGAFRQGTRLSD
jgi:bifunctional NMN adenylyltransferase/nudix hydrolase